MHLFAKLFFSLSVLICIAASSMCKQPKEEWIDFNEIKDLLHRPSLHMLTRALDKKFRRYPKVQGGYVMEMDFRRQKFLSVK